MCKENNRKEQCCAIISGGEPSDLSRIGEGAFVIACDRGYRYAREAGIRADMVLGDFDSLEEAYDGEVEPLVYPREKDDTDTMLAVRHALELGFRDLEIHCALGGRMDHLYGNVQAAVFAVNRGASVRLLGQDSEYYFITNGTLQVERKEGYSLSVFSYSDRSTGVSIRGTKYEVEGISMTSDVPIGVSNEWKEDKALITVKEGILVVILSRL